MSDLENRIRWSLQEAGRAFKPSRSHEPTPATFIATRRRRLILRGAGAAAVVAAAVVVAVVLAPSQEVVDEPAPVAPRPVPEGPIDITARIDVAPRPLGIGIGRDRVFVSHVEEGVVEFVDPGTGRVADELRWRESRPYVAVAGDMVWTAGPSRLDGFRLGTQGRGTSSIRIGQPTDLVAGGGFLWVATSDPSGPADRYVVLQRTADDLAPVIVAPGPLGDRRFRSPLALDYGYGALWMTTQGGEDDGLLRWDPRSGSLQKVPGVSSASDVAVGAGGVWVYENTSRAGNARVMRLDPHTLEIEEVAGVKGYFGWLAADENGVWVLTAADETNRTLLRLDPLSGRQIAEAVPLGAGPFEMTSGFGAVWITDEGKGRLVRVDVASGP